MNVAHMRIALIYPPPWKMPLAGEPAGAIDPREGPPEGFHPSHLDGDFFQMPYGLLTIGAQAIAAGDLQIGNMGLGNFVSLAQAGQMKLIAVMSPKRSALVPDVPTFAEAGVGDFGVAEGMKGGRDGLALGVQHAVLERHLQPKRIPVFRPDRERHDHRHATRQRGRCPGARNGDFLLGGTRGGVLP